MQAWDIVWHDGWWKTAPCWLLTTMSSKCFSWCTLLFPWKSRNTKTKSEVSNDYQIRWCKLLDNYMRQDLLENELALVSRTKECTTVEDRVTETKSKAAVREFDPYPAISLTHLRPLAGPTWKWTNSDRLGNEGTYLCGGPSYGDEFQGGGERRLILFLPSLWRTSESRNRLKTPGRSFLQQQNISRLPGNRP